MALDFKDIKQLVDLMKNEGIIRLRTKDLEIEVTPKQQVLLTPAAKEVVARFPEKEKCRCGHNADEHNEFGCLLGCSLLACSAQEAANAADDAIAERNQRVPAGEPSERV
jgi:hypothetical protein